MPTKQQAAPASAWQPVDESATSAWQPVEEQQQSVETSLPAPSGGLTEIRPNQSDTIPHALEDTFSNIGAGGLGTLATLGRISPWGALADHLQGQPTIYEDAYHAVTHPTETGTGLVHALKDVATHPLENVAGAIGAAGAGGMIPEGANALAKIPTRAKAGRLFEETMGKAGDLPVSLNRSNEPLLRAFEMGERGMTRPKVVNQLMRRTTEPGAAPMTYREARDFGQSLSRQSSSEGMKLTPAMKAQVSKLAHAFKDDVGDTAEQAGVRPQYEQAMTDYARASRLRDALKKTAQWGVPIAVGGGFAGSALKKALQ